VSQVLFVELTWNWLRNVFGFYNYNNNPVTPELNALHSGCLLGFFAGVFKFQCMLLEKKAYLIGFSFKFNEIKCCTLLMNWLIR
jgi:hypothetical protein